VTRVEHNPTTLSWILRIDCWAVDKALLCPLERVNRKFDAPVPNILCVSDVIPEAVRLVSLAQKT
jgi:hypothetical protein